MTSLVEREYKTDSGVDVFLNVVVQWRAGGGEYSPEVLRYTALDADDRPVNLCTEEVQSYIEDLNEMGEI